MKMQNKGVKNFIFRPKLSHSRAFKCQLWESWIQHIKSKNQVRTGRTLRITPDIDRVPRLETGGKDRSSAEKILPERDSLEKEEPKVLVERLSPENGSEQEEEEEETALPELRLVDPFQLEEPVLTSLAPPRQYLDRVGSDSGSSVSRSYSSASSGQVQY